MICPRCDNILNAMGCQSCGWKTGDPWPAQRLVIDSPFPLKDRKLYPPPPALALVEYGLHDMTEILDKSQTDPGVPPIVRTGSTMESISAEPAFPPTEPVAPKAATAPTPPRTVPETVQ